MPRQLPQSLAHTAVPHKLLNPPEVIVYIFDPQEVEQTCAAILAASVAVIGMDIEWWARFKTGEGQRPVASIQVCYQTPGRHSPHHTCVIIHICRSGPTPSLITLLESESVKKVGVGINGDVHKLFRDLGCTCGGVVDLNEEANRRQLGNSTSLVAAEFVAWTLNELTEKLFKRSLDKAGDIRCCNWEQWPLPHQQQLYAACDAFASLLVYCALQQRPLLAMPALRPPSGSYITEVEQC